MDNIPAGFEAGKDYVSAVSADNYGNGVISAHLMAKALGGKGKIGVVYHDADFFVTKQRYEASAPPWSRTIRASRSSRARASAARTSPATRRTPPHAMLSKHSDLDGIWAVWDVPAEGVLAAARAAGRLDLKIATEDLGKIVAINMAKNTWSSASAPRFRSTRESPRPGWVPAPSSASRRRRTSPCRRWRSPTRTCCDAWKQVYHEDPPADLQSSFVASN